MINRKPRTHKDKQICPSPDTNIYTSTHTAVIHQSTQPLFSVAADQALQLTSQNSRRHAILSVASLRYSIITHVQLIGSLAKARLNSAHTSKHVHTHGCNSNLLILACATCCALRGLPFVGILSLRADKEGESRHRLEACVHTKHTHTSKRSCLHLLL